MPKKIKKITKKEKVKDNKSSQQVSPLMQNIMLPSRVVQQIAEEVGKAVSMSLLNVRRKRKAPSKKIENAILLDTSAIIDNRIFDLAKIGVFWGNFVVLESVLRELKAIADSKDDVKKERGRRAMKNLDEFKKTRGVKLIILNDEIQGIPVDEAIIKHAKKYSGRIITCDYNLSKKAKIGGVVSIDLYEMVNILKTQAIPGETFFVKVIQTGKGEGQGVGYLPDGTMIVVERGEQKMGKTVEVVVSRIIQTDAGKILFSKIK